MEEKPGALFSGSSQTWLDRKANPESIAAITGMVGPCGIPKSRFALSPYRVGMAVAPVCESDIKDCDQCPMNPNRKQNET